MRTKRFSRTNVIVVAASGAWLATVIGVAQPARATLYWDVDGAVPGPGTFINGGWSSTSFNWTGDPMGSTPTQPWQNNDAAVFTAGTYGGGFLVSVIGGVNADSIAFEDGFATVNGGVVVLTGAGGIINVTAASAQMNAGVGGMVGLTKTGAGTLTLGVPPGYSGVTTVSAGQLTLDGADLTQSSALNVATGATFALVSPNFDTVVNTTSYSIAGTGRIDLTDNKLISNNAAGTESGGLYSGVQGDVQRASNGGAWNQPGLTTSLPDAVIGRTSIGVATGAQIRGLGPTATAIFAGQTITGVSTVAMYTYAGDANLDGLISGDDYSAIDFNVAIAGADGWVNGDFNYDGVISGDDYSAIDFNIVAQGSPFPTGAAASSLAAVPEPAAISVLVATVAYLLPPRSRRRR